MTTPTPREFIVLWRKLAEDALKWRDEQRPELRAARNRAEGHAYVYTKCADDLAASLGVGERPQEKHDDDLTRAVEPVTLPPERATASASGEGLDAKGQPTTYADHRLPWIGRDTLHGAFVCGAKWWEFSSTGGTMWASDRDKAWEEAERRYGALPNEPQPADAVARGVGEGQSRPRAHKGLDLLAVRETPQPQDDDKAST